MNSKLLLAALLLAATPCAFSQSAPAPATDTAPPPARPAPRPARPDDRDRDRGKDRDRRPEPAQGMRGPKMDDDMGGPFGHILPHGTWWRNPELAARIGLSAEQQKRIDDIFLQTRVQLIDLHASLEKEQLVLQPLLDANPIDQPKALAQINKIADTRAEVEKADAKMLLNIRGVLNADQWTKLQEGHRGPARDGQDMRGPKAPQPPR
jgi:Spy/CpxP family protein refolding chaperone